MRPGRALRVSSVAIAKVEKVELDPQVRARLARTWKRLLAVGIVAIVIGCVAIVLPRSPRWGPRSSSAGFLVIVGAFLAAAAFAAHASAASSPGSTWAVLTFVVGL